MLRGDRVEAVSREERLACREELALLEADVLGEQSSERQEISALERARDGRVLEPRPLRESDLAGGDERRQEPALLDGEVRRERDVERAPRLFDRELAARRPTSEHQRVVVLARQTMEAGIALQPPTSLTAARTTSTARSA